MGLTPDPRGLLPETDVKRLEEWGAAIKKNFSEPIAFTSAKGKEIFLSLKNPQTIKNIVLQEDISQGQRVRAYSVQTLTDGEWKIIAEGESIGHKRIHLIEPSEVLKLRLEIQQSILPPIIEQFSVY
tara:strand:- start:78 stop:458 length:381 start_codon:yes stop_codon:yes gene_type:complete